MIDLGGARAREGFDYFLCYSMHHVSFMHLYEILLRYFYGCES